MLSLPLKLILGTVAGTAIVAPTAYAITHSSSQGVQLEEVKKNCWEITGGTDEDGEQKRYLIVCKDDETSAREVKYYLNVENAYSKLDEVEEIHIKDLADVTLTLVAKEEDRKKEEKMRLLQVLNLGNDLNLKSDCAVNWGKENERKQITCTKNNQSKHKTLTKFRLFKK